MQPFTNRFINRRTSVTFGIFSCSPHYPFWRQSFSKDFPEKTNPEWETIQRITSLSISDRRSLLRSFPKFFIGHSIYFQCLISSLIVLGEEASLGYYDNDLLALSMIFEDSTFYKSFRKIVNLREIRPREKLCVAVGKIAFDCEDSATLKINDEVMDDELKDILGDHIHLIIAGLLINRKLPQKIDALREFIRLLAPKKSDFFYSLKDLISVCSLPLLVVCLKYTGHSDLAIRSRAKGALDFLEKISNDDGTQMIDIHFIGIIYNLNQVFCGDGSVFEKIMMIDALLGLLPRLDKKNLNSNHFWATVYLAAKISDLQDRLFMKLYDLSMNLDHEILGIAAIRLISILSCLACKLDRVATIHQVADIFLKRLENDKTLQIRIAAIVPNSNLVLGFQDRLRALKDISTDSDPVVSLTGLKLLDTWISDPENFGLLSKIDLQSLYSTLNHLSERASLDEERGILICSLFGYLGIVDTNTSSEVRQVLPCLTIKVEDDLDELCCVLIEKHLFQSMRSAANSKWQDKVAFVIQELCKVCFFNLEFDTSSGRHEARWLKFPEVVRKSIEPLLHTRYTMSFLTSTAAQSEIFNPSLPYQEWLHRWTTDLISRIDDLKQRQVFVPCRALSRSDQNTVRTIIMSIISRLLRSDPRAQEYVAREILSLLAHGRILLETHNERDRRFVAFFRFLFFFDDYLRHWKFALLKAQDKPLCAELQLCLNSLEKLDRLFSPYDFACCSVLCEDHQRALYYLEKYLSRNPSSNQDVWVYRLFQICYAGLSDSDGMEGILTRLQTRDLDSAILAYETSRNWEAALACYEIQLRYDINNVRLNYGYLRCLRNLGRLDPILRYASNLRNENLCEIGRPFLVEAAWRLRAWKVLDETPAIQQPATFDDDIGLLLKNTREKDLVCLERSMTEAKRRVWRVLSSKKHLAESIVQRAMIQSLILHDITLFANHRNRFLDQSFWAERLNRANCSILVREPIINLRMILLELNGGIDKDSGIGAFSAISAKLARKEGLTSLAQKLLLESADQDSASCKFEQTKLWWVFGEKHRALKALLSLITEIHASPDSSTNGASLSLPIGTPTMVSRYSKYMLLAGRWAEELSQSHSNDILAKYIEVTTLERRWDKGYYYLGHYQSKLLEHERQTNSHSDASEFPRNARLPLTYTHATYLLHVVKNYVRCLIAGDRFIFEALPKLLTLWLDFAAQMAEEPLISIESDYSKLEDVMQQVHNTIEAFIERVPPYVLVFGLHQVVSRLCHANETAVRLLDLIMYQIAQTYPQHALWATVSMSKSTVMERTRRWTSISSKLKSIELFKTISRPFVLLTDQLVSLCNFSPSQHQTNFHIDAEFRNLRRLFPLPIIMPLERALVPVYSSCNRGLQADQVFVANVPRIQGIGDEVEVLNSLQKPKKIVLIGNDGTLTPFLCKPKDDLRKDARVMEFDSMINVFLKRNDQARRRQLYIRTYAVLPLNEECGLIEWVPDTASFRSVILKLWKTCEVTTQARDLKALLKQKKTLREIFLQDLLPMHPLVFHRWFFEEFLDPYSWFRARKAFAKTAAVMSFVGYVLGLGDRHGENILLDVLTGDCIHVDFSCLFDKGLSFEKPEKVPFRLTRNMTDGMGPFGLEGWFRKCGEATLSVLRENRDSLKSSLESFIYDPLVEWTHVKASKTPDKMTEIGHKTLQIIEKKVLGQHRTGLPLSVEGQVDELIAAATSIDNLCQMYIGWGAYM